MAKETRILRTCLKVVDRFTAQLLVDGKVVAEHDNYVPDFMPEDHYGDYVELDIDIDTGQILNWKKPTKAELKAQLDTWL
tara:strand:+ start:55 stop:294 length:240 start_codon:yes stop_codon:yes gene_type:complete